MDALLKRAFESTFEQLAGEFGSFDQAVLLKSKAEHAFKQERHAKNKRKLPAKKPQQKYCPL